MESSIRTCASASPPDLPVPSLSPRARHDRSIVSYVYHLRLPDPSLSLSFPFANWSPSRRSPVEQGAPPAFESSSSSAAAGSHPSPPSRHLTHRPSQRKAQESPADASSTGRTELDSTPTASSNTPLSGATATASAGSASSTVPDATAGVAAAETAAASSPEERLPDDSADVSATPGRDASGECGAPEPCAAEGRDEEGLDMTDFEELLLDHLKTSEYPPGEFVFR